MKTWTSAAVFLLGAMWLGPARATPSADPADVLRGRLVIVGSNTMAPLVSSIARRFEALHPGVRIEVQAGGSRRGLEHARNGEADIGMVSRALREGERDMQGLPIARDGVALVVHRDNPVRSLTGPQVAGIYAGRITNWKHVGGRDAPIIPYRAEADRASSELFAAYFGLGPGLKALPAEGDTSARLRRLAEEPDAVLYSSVGVAERAAQSGLPLRLLPAGGVAASSRNIRNGHFPISRPLTLAVRERPSGLAMAFIEYCGTSQITDLVIAHDFVPYLD